MRYVSSRLILPAFAVCVCAISSSCRKAEEEIDFEAYIKRPDVCKTVVFPPATLEEAAVALCVGGYDYNGRDVFQQVGCGLLVCDEYGSRDRFYIATCAHVYDKAIEACKQTGVFLKLGFYSEALSNAILRLDVPADGIFWHEADRGNDLVFGEITVSIETLEALGVSARGIDLDAIGIVDSHERKHFLYGAGVAPSIYFKRLGFGSFSHASVVCAKSNMGDFVRKEAFLLRQHIRALHRTGGATRRSDTLVVHDFDGNIEPGDSGAPVYMKGNDGIERLVGIVAGREREFFSVIPADFILQYAERLRRKASGQFDILPDDRLACASMQQFNAEDNKTVRYPVTLWHDGTRKVRVAIEGDCSLGNSLEAVFIVSNECGKCDPKADDVYLTLGWNNLKGDGAEPGRNNLVLDIYFDEHGEAKDYKINDGALGVLDYQNSNQGIVFSPKIDTLLLNATGTPFSNGRITIELFEENLDKEF